jgi:ATP-dependent DNA helicase Rep
LRRIVNYPARGIGEITLEKLAAQALTRGWSLWEAVERVDALDDVPGAAREGCRALERIAGDARRALFAGKQAPGDVARTIVEQVSLKAEIETHAPSTDVAAKRWASVEAVLATLARRDVREGGGIAGLSAFLQLLTLDLKTETEDPSEAITLSTLHGSKGLEFDVVFLIGCEEGYLPHARTLDTRATDVKATENGGADIEEERRLFYVGVTRARERLVLSRAKFRVLRGKPSPRTPSRFLLDVPPEFLEEREISHEAPTTPREAADHAGAILAMLQGTGKRPG